MVVDPTITLDHFDTPLAHLWQTARRSVIRLARDYQDRRDTPVFTVRGKYQPQGWTEWTHGFQYGCGLLVFDATDDAECLEIGRQGIYQRMAPHVSHHGVHDHGFNTMSTYAHLRRLLASGRLSASEDGIRFCDLAVCVSGAVQAARWTAIDGQQGFIHSFNGPHSLFADTLRSLRVLARAHQLGHVLWGENDQRISLLERWRQHAVATAQYNVYYGEGRDHYDVPGRVAHESIFNVKDGHYRCPSSQQGYSPFSTWTRGLAWVLLGFAEQLEFLDQLPPDEQRQLAAGPAWPTSTLRDVMVRAARATGDFYVRHTSQDGIPCWDTGAPGLTALPRFAEEPADPYNRYEPVDSSAAAIAAQGLLRLAHYLQPHDPSAAQHYWQAGLTVARTLLRPPYLNDDPDHHGVLLHTVYHRPRGWDFIPPGQAIPCGESALWGDYHLLELGLYLQRLRRGEPYYAFWA